MAESTGALWEGQLTVAMEEMTGNHGRTVSAEKERERKEHIVQVGDLHGPSKGINHAVKPSLTLQV